MIPKFDGGTAYKKHPWTHLTPYRIWTIFKWDIANCCIIERVLEIEEGSVVTLAIGITDQWGNAKVAGSPPGANLYVQMQNPSNNKRVCTRCGAGAGGGTVA